jgi:hypothetical protein
MPNMSGIEAYRKKIMKDPKVRKEWSDKMSAALRKSWAKRRRKAQMNGNGSYLSIQVRTYTNGNYVKGEHKSLHVVNSPYTNEQVVEIIKNALHEARIQNVRKSGRDVLDLA